MKILLFGAQGMLGTDIAASRQTHEVIGMDKTDCDITDANAVARVIFERKPSMVINAAAYTDVDGAEEKADEAMRVNSDGVQNIAAACAKYKVSFAHFSTDYVFDGVNKNGYQESDIRNPLNVYGASKKKGEDALFAYAHLLSRWYCIRTSWLFGKNGENFVDAIQRLFGKTNPVRVVQDQIGKPTYTHDLAVRLWWMIETNVLSGVYHATNEGACSWYTFAKCVADACGYNGEITPCMTHEFPRPARRPSFSALLNTKLPPLSHWSDALKRYLL